MPRSRLDRSFPIAVCLTFAAPGALADRQGAPISYADTAERTSLRTAPAPQVGQPSQVRKIGSDERTQRIQFVYPTQGQAAQQAASVTGQAVTTPIRVAAVTNPAPRATGQPLQLSRVKSDPAARISQERGLAGVYADGFDGRPTANGEIFSETGMTAAHRSLPLPSLVRVTNDTNGREVVVRVNDRGPFTPNRLIELTPRAAQALGMSETRDAQVTVKYLGPAPVVRSDMPTLASEVTEEPMSAPRTQVATTRPVVSAPAPIPNSQRRPTPPVTRSVQAKETTGIFVQVGSFTDISNAKALNDALGGGMPVQVQPARVNGADYFRVFVGPFNSRGHAENYRDHLADMNIADGFVVSR